jgi:hypothetical protein
VAIRIKEPNVPSHLPPARLFLDDIEEIVRIFRDTVESQELGPYSREIGDGNRGQTGRFLIFV